MPSLTEGVPHPSRFRHGPGALVPPRPALGTARAPGDKDFPAARDSCHAGQGA